MSETGYRSFLGIYAEPVAGLTPDEFAAKVIAANVARELKGKLVAIAPSYRKNPTEDVDCGYRARMNSEESDTGGGKP